MFWRDAKTSTPDTRATRKEIRRGDHPAIKLRHSFVLRHSDFVIRLDSSKPDGVQNYARTGTEAVRSSLPQLTHAPFTPRKIAFQMQ
jgi:hypothetical protein